MDSAYRQYAPIITKYVQRRVSGHLTSRTEDLVADTFVRAWVARDSYAETGKLLHWLFRVASSVLIDAARARSRRPVAVQFFDAYLEVPCEQTSGIEQFEDAQVVAEVLSKLKQRHASVLALTVEGYSDREISQVLGCPQSSVRQLRFRARVNGRKVVRGNGLSQAQD